MISLIKKNDVKIGVSEYIKILICALILVLISSFNVYADTKELTMNVNNDYTNAAFSITWEKYDKEADVEIVSPDGKTYSKKETPDAVYAAPGEAVISVGQPAKGEWNRCECGTGSKFSYY